MQDLGQGGFHPRALTRSKDNGGLGHGTSGNALREKDEVTIYDGILPQ
jgi:hypothetical protein